MLYSDVKLDKFDNSLNLTNKIKDRKISLSDAKSNQKDFKKELEEIKKGNTKKKKKSKEQKNDFYNIEMLYKARKEVIQFYDV